MSKKLSRLIMTSIAIFKIMYAKSGYYDSIDIHISLSNIKLSKMFRKTYINLSHQQNLTIQIVL